MSGTFFTTGNVVVKVGVIILFFGVAFLLKYAAQRNAFPIELRLISVAAGAIGMLIFGWRLRHTKAPYALVLQGGAVGILYLTVFSAAKLYTVLPLGFTFFVMIALAKNYTLGGIDYRCTCNSNYGFSSYQTDGKYRLISDSYRETFRIDFNTCFFCRIDRQPFLEYRMRENYKLSKIVL